MNSCAYVFQLSLLELSENSNKLRFSKGMIVDKYALCTYTVYTNIKNKRIFVNMVKIGYARKMPKKRAIIPYIAKYGQKSPPRNTLYYYY